MVRVALECKVALAILALLLGLLIGGSFALYYAQRVTALEAEVAGWIAKSEQAFFKDVGKVFGPVVASKVTGRTGPTGPVGLV